MVAQRPRPLHSASNYKSENYRDFKSLQDWRQTVFELLGGLQDRHPCSVDYKDESAEIDELIECPDSSSKEFSWCSPTIVITNNNGSKHLLRGMHALIIKLGLEYSCSVN